MVLLPIHKSYDYEENTQNISNEKRGITILRLYPHITINGHNFYLHFDTITDPIYG